MPAPNALGYAVMHTVSMRSEREGEGKTDLRKRTWVAPESARMGEGGAIEHRFRGVFVRNTNFHILIWERVQV